MVASCSRIICCLLLAAMCLTASARGPVDCTRFLYAPACRGVAAKRSFLPAERDMFTPDAARKMSGLEQLLELYATPAPLEEARRQPESWAAVEQAPKPEMLYDWYLSSLKRSKESSVYDY